jgi:hypothetical protein
MVQRKIDKVKVQDPDGEAWHAEASSRWAAAARQAGSEGPEALEVYDPPAFPDFTAQKASTVGREVFGRFVQDRETGMVHDVTVATEACGVDGIANATFFHFWTEVLEDATADVPCPRCFT